MFIYFVVREQVDLLEIMIIKHAFQLSHKDPPKRCWSSRAGKMGAAFQNPRHHQFLGVVITTKDFDFFGTHQRTNLQKLAEISCRTFTQLIHSVWLTGSWKMYA